MKPIKICGLTRTEDASLALELGAQALGFIFHAPSPRAVSPATVAEILKTLDLISSDSPLPLFAPGSLATVGVFVDTPMREVAATAQLAQLNTVQLHGHETPEDTLQLKALAPHLRVIKALRVREAQDLHVSALHATTCDALLLDAQVEGQAGGTGQKFDWSLVQNFHFTKPVILAGGLRVENIREAITQTSVDAFDISSGVEARPGIKDEKKMRAFFAAAHAAASKENL